MALGKIENEAPILLTGVYRSGTGILHQIVAAHPRVSMTYDAVKFLRFGLGRFDPIEQRYGQLVDETKKRLGIRWGIPFDSAKASSLIEQGGEITYAHVYRALMRTLLLEGESDARRWGEKNAMVWEEVPQFLQMFPNGQVIHIVRDPRDTVASYKKITFEPMYTYLDGALNCLHAMHRVEEYLRQYGDKRIMVVRLEDLTADPETTARKICAFLDLEYSPEMLNPSRFKDKVGKLWRNNSAFDEKGSGIFRNVERWRNHLTSAEIAFVELIAAPMMKHYGYQASGKVPSQQVWQEMYTFFEDPYIKEGYELWLATGDGRQRYRTDPMGVELRAIGAA
jgi:hypothetical protein